MLRCSECVLPEVYPNIIFDDNGVCNFCREYEKIAYLGSKKLQEDLSAFIKSNGKYDCLVPISGGKDSTYVLYQMSKVYGMKVLAFNYDNCLTHPKAQQNVEKIAYSLGVDLIIKKNERQKQYMTVNLKSYLRKPSVGMIPMLCTGCRYGIIGNALKVAKDHKIPIIVIGWSPIEDTPFKEVYLKKNGNSVIKGLVYNIISNPSYIKPGNMLAAVKDYFHNYQHVKDWNIVLKMLHPGVKLISFYDYIPYNPDEIQSIVEKEVGWETPDKKNSWQWDCKIKLLQNYFYDKEVNFTATDDFLSAQVREGFINRTEAINRLEYSVRNKEEKLYQIHIFLKENNLEELSPYFT
jgi:hypothetical protein